MNARPDTTILLDAQDALSKAKHSTKAMQLLGEGLLMFDREAANAIVDLSNVIRKRIEKASRKIERYRKGESGDLSQGAS